MGHVITVAQQKGGSGKTTLAATLAVGLARAGERVAVMDTDPQGSLGRWFLERAERGDPGMEFTTSSAWGAGWEVKKLLREADWVVIDTPPKIDGDLRPCLKAADLVLVPVSLGQADVWAVEGVVKMAREEGREVLVVLNRAKAGTRVQGQVEAALAELGVPVAEARLGHRVAYAEALGQGRGPQEGPRGAWTAEAEALVAAVREAAA